MRYFTSEYFDGAGNEHDREMIQRCTRSCRAARQTVAASYKADHPDAQFSYSYMMRRLLELRLRKALSNLSCLQQRNDMRTYGEARQSHGEERAKEIMAENRQWEETAEAENEDIARDLVMALTGREIDFVPKEQVKESPYGNLSVIGRSNDGEQRSPSAVNPEAVMKVINDLERTYGDDR
jgi:hypothetical protein